MRKIRLGRTDVEVPSIGSGTWGHGGAEVDEGQPVGWSGHDDELATAALLEAYRLGLTHWDTADAYGQGQAERLIGSLWDRVPRQEIFLASKVGWEVGPYDHAYHPEQMRRQLECSLRGLATDWIDLYYLHRCDFGSEDEYLDGAIELLDRFREEGKIRFLGLSDWASELIVRYVDRVDPDVVQTHRSVIYDQYETSGLKAWVEKNDAGAVYFSPLRHGLLLGRYEEPPELGEGDHRSLIPAFRDRAFLAHLRDCRDAVNRRFAENPQPVLHVLIGVLLADSPTGCALLGLRRPEHARAAAAVGEPLRPVDVEWVRELYRRVEPEQKGGPWLGAC